MHTSAVLAAILVGFASQAAAKSCHSGGVYCGQSLLNRGDYRNHIVQVLKANRQATDESHIEDSLFDCLNGGEISLVKYCTKGCGGVGSTKDDFCL